MRNETQNKIDEIIKAIQMIVDSNVSDSDKTNGLLLVLSKQNFILIQQNEKMIQQNSELISLTEFI